MSSFNNFKIILILLPAFKVVVQDTLPWDHWSWSVPQVPIEYFFRRRYEHNNLMPIKNPNVVCQCPPNTECTMEYKFNEDMLHFLHLKGLVKNEEVNKLKEEILNSNDRMNIDDALVRRKRNGKIVGSSKELTRNCCCPPRSVKLPAFITNNRFDEVIERISGIKKGS